MLINLFHFDDISQYCDIFCSSVTDIRKRRMLLQRWGSGKKDSQFLVYSPNINTEILVDKAYKLKTREFFSLQLRKIDKSKKKKKKM